MATVINTQPAEERSSSALGVVLALIALLVLALLFYFIGAPILRNRSNGTQINVPDQIDVNVDSQQ